MRLAQRGSLILPGLVLGGTLAACGAGMLVCGGVAIAGDGRAVAALMVPGGATLALGLALLAAFSGSSLSIRVIRPVNGFAAVTLAWVVAAAVGAIPLMAAGSLTSPLDAYFEAMSGFTTLGGTLLRDIQAEPDGILMWRQMAQWFGGIGIIVLVVAVAPVSGAAIQRVFYAEASGVTADRLTPRIADTAKIITGIYLVFSATILVAYLAVGMDLFDAVAHMFSSIATGGFSPRNGSIGSFDSLAVELVAITGMVMGGVNFAFYWQAVKHKPVRPQSSEVAVYLAVLVAAIAVVTASLVIADEQELWRGLRGAAFTVTSMLTTTGYTTVDFDAWNDFARMLLLVLMVIGGCAGSTSGGMKVIRTILLVKIARQEVRRQIQPQRVQVLRVGGRSFSDQIRTAVMGFALIYTLLLVAGAVAYAACGLDFDTSISASIVSLNMIGPGLGDIGAIESYAAMPDGARVVAIVMMLIGRLEIFTVVALLGAIFGAHRRH